MLIVTLLTDLTFEWFMEFDDQVRQALPATVAAGVLDLSAVQHLDSSGLGVVARLHRDLKARGGRLALAGAAPHLQNLLRMVGFHQHLQTWDTLAEALASFRPAATPEDPRRKE